MPSFLLAFGFYKYIIYITTPPWRNQLILQVVPPHWSELWHDVVGGRDDYLTGNTSCNNSHNVVGALATGPGTHPGLPAPQHSQHSPSGYSLEAASFVILLILDLDSISKCGITLPRSCNSQVSTIGGFCSEKLIRTQSPFCSSKDGLSIQASCVCLCARTHTQVFVPVHVYEDQSTRCHCEMSSQLTLQLTYLAGSLTGTIQLVKPALSLPRTY